MKKIFKAFSVFAAIFAFGFAGVSCDGFFDGPSDGPGGDPSDGPSDKISVTVVYKDLTDLSEDDLSSLNDDYKYFDAMDAEAKAEYSNDKEQYAWPNYYLVPTAWRYYSGKTYSLTVNEVKEKFPSNMFTYYTTYNSYPEVEWDSEAKKYVDRAGNVKWDGKTTVESLKVLYEPKMGWHISMLQKEEDELRYYFWDDDVKQYTFVMLYWKGLEKCGAGELCAGWTYEMYEFFSDEARTTKVNWSDFEDLSKIYMSIITYEKYNVTFNDGDRVEMTLEQAKAAYPESEGYKWYWYDVYSERGGYYGWGGQQDIEIYDEDHEPSEW